MMSRPRPLKRWLPTAASKLPVMQAWIVFAAWGFAVVFALVVLGFAGYEISWKTRRLQVEQARLQQLTADLAQLGSRLQASAERLR